MAIYEVVIPAHPQDDPLSVAVLHTHVDCADIEECHEFVAGLCHELDDIGLCVGPAYGQATLIRPRSVGFGLDH